MAAPNSALSLEFFFLALGYLSPNHLTVLPLFKAMVNRALEKWFSCFDPSTSLRTGMSKPVVSSFEPGERRDFQQSVNVKHKAVSFLGFGSYPQLWITLFVTFSLFYFNKRVVS